MPPPTASFIRKRFWLIVFYDYIRTSCICCSDFLQPIQPFRQYLRSLHLHEWATAARFVFDHFKLKWTVIRIIWNCLRSRTTLDSLIASFRYICPIIRLVHARYQCFEPTRKRYATKTTITLKWFVCELLHFLRISSCESLLAVSGSLYPFIFIFIHLPDSSVKFCANGKSLIQVFFIEKS